MPCRQERNQNLAGMVPGGGRQQRGRTCTNPSALIASRVLFSSSIIFSRVMHVSIRPTVSTSVYSWPSTSTGYRCSCLVCDKAPPLAGAHAAASPLRRWQSVDFPAPVTPSTSTLRGMLTVAVAGIGQKGNWRCVKHRAQEQVGRDAVCSLRFCNSSSFSLCFHPQLPHVSH